MDGENEDVPPVEDLPAVEDENEEDYTEELNALVSQVEAHETRIATLEAEKAALLLKVGELEGKLLSGDIAPNGHFWGRKIRG